MAEDAHTPYGTHVRLAYGMLSTGDIVHVSQVENGSECACVCPACGEALIAKQGEILSWHFSHVSGEECADIGSLSFLLSLERALGSGVDIHVSRLEMLYGGVVKTVPAQTLTIINVKRKGDMEVGYYIHAACIYAGKTVDICLLAPRKMGHETFDGLPVHVSKTDDGYCLTQCSGRVLADWYKGQMVKTRLSSLLSWEWVFSDQDSDFLEAQISVASSGISGLLFLDVFTGLESSIPDKVWRLWFVHDLILNRGKGSNKVLRRHNIVAWLEWRFSYPLLQLTEADRKEFCLVSGHFALEDSVMGFVRYLESVGVLRLIGPHSWIINS